MPTNEKALRCAEEYLRAIDGDDFGHPVDGHDIDDLVGIILKYFPEQGVDDGLLKACKRVLAECKEPQCLDLHAEPWIPDDVGNELRAAISAAERKPTTELEDELAEACVMVVGFLSVTAPDSVTLAVVKRELAKYTAKKGTK